jgi:hypothetical protein
MVTSQKDWLVLKSVAAKKTPEELEGKVIIGEFVNIERHAPANAAAAGEQV